MKNLFLILLLFGSFVFSQAQEIKVFDNYDALQKELFTDKETLYVVNFWATWCAPCIKELPYFEQLFQKTKNQNVKIILVSLDFKDQINTKLKAFANKKKYSSQIVALTDKNYNNWLEKVSKDWSGSIPATLLIKGEKYEFKEHEFSSVQELEDFVKTIK